MAFTIDTTFGELLDDPQAKAVFDKYLPGLSSHPMVPIARGMPISMILATQQAAQLGMTREKVEAILEEVNQQIK